MTSWGPLVIERDFTVNDVFYLSGPMTGLEDSNYPAFHAAADLLRLRGLSVLNPAETDAGSSDRSRSFYLRIDIENLLLATKVVLLPGWDDSAGSQLEVAIARELGLELLKYPDLTTIEGVLRLNWVSSLIGKQPEFVEDSACGPPTRASTFPNTAEERKRRPVATGVLDYFPDALVEVAHVSWRGNEQHQSGTPVHWERSKSADESDALIRHFLQRGQLDTDGMRHSAKMAWRALAFLQKELERDCGSA